MPELFVVYNIHFKKTYLITMDDSSIKWNEYATNATQMEKAIAALWVNVLQIQEPRGIFGMERA